MNFGVKTRYGFQSQPILTMWLFKNHFTLLNVSFLTYKMELILASIHLECILQCIPCLRNYTAAAAAAKSLQSCPTLWDPIDSSPPGSAVPGILQARTLEWVAISFSNAGKWKVKARSLSRVRLFATPWTVAYQAFPSMRFSRQKHWSGLPFPSPVHESEKWKWSRSIVSDSVWPHGL